MKKTLLLFILTLFTQLLIAQSFTSTVNSGALLEGGSVNFTQVVSGLPINQNYSYGLFEIDIYLTHPATSEVYLNLVAPDGNTISLTSAYGNGSNFNHTKFRSFAGEFIGNADIINNGKFMPENKFTDLQNNSDPNGTWTLYYYDGITNSVVGDLIDWTLTFKNFPNQLATDSMITNLPIFNFVMPASIPNSPKLAGSMHVFSNSANALINTPNIIYNVGAEIQGFTSSNGSKPNYDFEIRNATNASLPVPLLGMPAESDWILKSGYTDEYLMKDPLTFEFSRRMGYYAPRTKHIELFINGEYLGVYILMEKIKRGANRVDVSKMKPSDTSAVNITGGYIFEINPNGASADWYSSYLGFNGTSQTNGYEFKIVYPKKDSIVQKQKSYLKSYVDSFETAMDGTNFQDVNIGWRKYVDEKSFIDFLIVSEYSINYDTYGRSMYFNKQKSTKGNKIIVGPPWDSDRGYDINAVSTGWVHINTHGLWTFPFWWSKARQDTLFEKKLACRFKTFRNYVLTDTAINNYLNGLDALLKNARQREIVKWNKYFEQTNTLKNIMIDRLNWMDIELQSVTFPPIPVVNSISFINNPININIGNQYRYNFRPGPDTSYFNPGITGFYTAVISNQYGCESQKKFSVEIPAPLAIIPINFAGKWVMQKNVLNWHVSETSDIQKFEIEYSSNGIDFIKIGDADYNNYDYEFVYLPNSNYNFYRIKLLTITGDVQYSKTISLVQQVNNSLSIYPNPASDILYIQHANADKINILNAVGKVIISQTQNTFEVNIANLPLGVYTVQIINGLEIVAEQFVKQ